MTCSRPGVRERPPRFRYEPPVVARGMERQLQHAERVVVADFVGLQRRAEWMVRFSARADDELPYAGVAPRGVGAERRNALVDVCMTGEHEFHARRCDVTP